MGVGFKLFYEEPTHQLSGKAGIGIGMVLLSNP